MNQQEIIGLALIAVIVVLLFWMLHNAGHRATYVMETSEEVDGERTLIANTVLAVLQFAMKDLHAEEPIAATSPDGQRSYFRVLTPEGHVIIQFDWQRKKVHLFHAYHSENADGIVQMRLKIRNNLVDEIKLAEFGRQVTATELEIIEHKILNSDGFKNLVLQTLASAAAENSENDEENGGE